MADAPDRFIDTPGQEPAWGATERSETYTPLSLLAVAGIILAVFYAVLVSLGGIAVFAARYPRLVGALVVLTPLVSVGIAAGMRHRGAALGRVAGFSLLGLFTLIGLAGLVAFSGTNPWVMPGWTLLLPVGSALVCWMARARIAASEGTLAGDRMAAWGLGLSLGFGLLYGAYLMAGSFAVRQQAEAFTLEWLKLIREGELNRAFLLTASPAARPTGPGNLRDTLEVTFNAPQMPGELGNYSAFLRAQYVRMIRMGGAETRFDLLGVTPEFDQGIHRVTCRYRITTPQASLDLIVVAKATETGKAVGSREWEIVANATGPFGNPEHTPLGEKIGMAFIAARSVFDQFFALLRIRALDGAYLLTLPPAERAAQSDGVGRLFAAGPAGGLGAVAVPGALTFLNGRHAFQTGNIVVADPQKFWAGEKYRADVIDEVRASFSPRFRALGNSPSPRMPELPVYRTENGQSICTFTISMLVNEAAGPPKYSIEMDVTLTADGDAPPSADVWTVKSVELLRAVRAPDQMGGKRPR